MVTILVHRFDQITELCGEAARADELQVVRAAVERDRVLGAPDFVGSGATAHHVHVQLRDDRVARHGRMIGEEARAEQSLLFAGVPHE